LAVLLFLLAGWAGAAPAPDEHPDLSTMSIAEIARLAERGAI